MNISKIQFSIYQRGYHTEKKANNQQYYYNTADFDRNCFGINSNNKDIFIKSKPNSQAVSFQGIHFDTYEFEQQFTRNFFKKLLKEGITDAYSENRLISREDLDYLVSLGTLNKKSAIAIKELKEYRDCMFDIEKKIFIILESLSKKHPDLTLQELLKLKYAQAEKILIKQQGNVLNKINFMIRELPTSEYKDIRKLIQESFDQIFEPNPTPENRFSRQRFIRELKRKKISDKTKREKILQVAQRLPQSSDSINAFIVKYSQPYKFKFNEKTGTQIKTTRDSEELGLRLLRPSEGTDDHIHSQKAFRAEQETLTNSSSDENTSTMRVTILSSKKMNGLKSDTEIDDFIRQTDPKIPTYIQKQINEFKEIAKRWDKAERTEDAQKLCDYIVVLKNEFETRSNIIKIDISDFEDDMKRICEKAIISEEKKKQKRIKKTGHADNSHKEFYPDKDGNNMENRKVQKHASRFAK